MYDILNDDYSRYIRNKPFEVGDTITYDLNYLKYQGPCPCVRTGKVIASYSLLKTNRKNLTRYIYKVEDEFGCIYDVDHNSIFQCYREC